MIREETCKTALCFLLHSHPMRQGCTRREAIIHYDGKSLLWSVLCWLLPSTLKLSRRVSWMYNMQSDALKYSAGNNNKDISTQARSPFNHAPKKNIGHSPARPLSGPLEGTSLYSENAKERTDDGWTHWTLLSSSLSPY